MTRMQTAATSLVAAIPAALLATLLAMAFLNHSESLKGMLPVLVGLTLACAALVAAMPFGILVLGGKKKAQADVSASQANPTVVVDGEEEEGMSTGDDIVTAADEEPTEEISETVDFDSAELSDVVDTELDDDLSDDDLFGDDEPPKKKKK